MTTATQPDAATAAVTTWLGQVRRSARRERPASEPPRLFTEESFWRDLIAFTWNIRTFEGRDEITRMLGATCHGSSPAAGRSLRRGTRRGGRRHRGVDRLRDLRRPRQGAAEVRDGRCWTLLTTLYELKGDEEPKGPRRPMGAEHGANRGPDLLAGKPGPGSGQPRGHAAALRSDRRRRAGRHRARRPATAAQCPGDRHRQAGPARGPVAQPVQEPVPARPVWHDHMPYLKFPDNWPVFSPKDKIADWLSLHQDHGAQLLAPHRGQERQL